MNHGAPGYHQAIISELNSAQWVKVNCYKNQQPVIPNVIPVGPNCRIVKPNIFFSPVFTRQWKRKHEVVSAGCSVTFKDPDLGPCEYCCNNTSFDNLHCIFCESKHEVMLEDVDLKAIL